MSETNKHREKFLEYCIGNGIDIGYGGSPIKPEAITFDLPKDERYSFVAEYPQNIEGDARDLSMFSDNSLDYVYSSHCIEDFEDTMGILCEWLRIVKFGGHLCLLFPDERVYRSKSKTHNANHKHKDFGLTFVLHNLNNINKAKTFCKEYSLHQIKAEESFENDDYNCIIVIQKVGI